MRMWTWMVGALCMGALLAGDAGIRTAEAAEKAGSYHKNEAWGFKLRTPNKWNVIHMSTKEKWIAMKAIGPRDLYGPKGEGWGMRPEMWVVAFPAERMRDRGAKRERTDDGTDENFKSFVIWVENPYKDYKDFVKREKRLALGSAGFYFTKEETIERGGKRIDVYEIKAEKMTDTPFRMVCWVWHTKDVAYAVQFKVPENHYDDYKKTFDTCLKSFKEIPRTQKMPGSTTTGPNIIDVEKEEKLTPEQRKKKRIEDVERYVQAEVENLPKDWSKIEDKQYVVISHGDKKFTKRVLTHAGLVRKYLEKTFPGLGDDYVPRGIIRIFKDSAEEQAFREGTRSIWLSDIRQIMLTSDRGFSQLSEFETLSDEIMQQWLYYKNRNLYNNMPYWLRNGMSQHVRKARPSKSKGLRFAPDTWDVLELVKLVKTDKCVSPKSIFMGEKPKEGEDGRIDVNGGTPPAGLPEGVTFGNSAHRIQSESLFHYLLMKGNRGKFKGSIRTYLATLISAIEEEDKKFQAEEDKRFEEESKRRQKELEENGGQPKDDDDEEDEEESLEESQKRWKEYASRLEAKRKAILEKCYAAAFGHITDKEWSRLDRSWKKWAERGGK